MNAVELVEVTSGLRFPEGPIAMPDGTVVLVEMFGPRITRVYPDGTKETIVEIEGGPNGAAIGPDGALYLCNNGGCFSPIDFGELLFPGPFDPGRYSGGRIQRVDLSTGAVTDLYTECGGHALRAPNDIVFDAHGGMWITDHGIHDTQARTADLSSIYYARSDGSSITEVVHPVDSPNGIGLSPDGNMLYWAETHHGRVVLVERAAETYILVNLAYVAERGSPREDAGRRRTDLFDAALVQRLVTGPHADAWKQLMSACVTPASSTGDMICALMSRRYGHREWGRVQWADDGWEYPPAQLLARITARMDREWEDAQ